MSDTERTSLITDLLLGAAHADGNLDGRETAKVKELIRKLSTDEETIARADARIEAFSPASFDVKSAAQSFASDPDEQKLHLLELVVQVHDADGELDLDEDSYLKDLGGALGLPDDAVGGLGLEYSVEEQQEHFDVLVDAPED